MEEGEEEEKLESFLKWAAKLGISDCISKSPLSCLGHSLSVNFFPNAGGRGLAAARDLRKGELILRVPKAALMNSQTILMQNQKLYIAVQRYPSLSPTQILTIALLTEVGKGKNSSWFPYLKHLPRSYDILASFGQLETQALQVDDGTWAAEKAIGKAELEWKEAIPLMGELKLKHKLQTLKAWLWASATISSRTLHIPWDEAGCLCPVGDLFNYAAPGEELFNCEDLSTQGNSSVLPVNSSQTTDKSDAEEFDVNSVRLTDGGYEEDFGAYCFYARKSYRKGEQILLSYGTYTNLELLEHYGFILNENPNDKAFIPLAPDMYSWCSWSTDSLYIHQNGKPSFALLAAVRLWATPPNQRKSVSHLTFSGSQLSKENEVIVMKWIAEKCHVILKNFQTSIKEDNLLLCTIDNIRGFLAPMELEKLPSTLKSQIKALLDANGIPNVEIGANISLSSQSMERWKLAVQWRLNYKKILADCISYCIERIDNLSALSFEN